MNENKNKIEKSDDFLNAIVFVIRWVKTRKRQFFFVLGIVASITILWVGASELNRHLENNASKAWLDAITLKTGSQEQKAALEEVAKKYSRRAAGKRALLQLGEETLKSNPEEARGYFEKLRAIAHEKHLIQVAALIGIAKSYEIQKMWKEAGDAYMKASSLPGNLLANQTKINAAMCFENAGQINTAKEIYTDLSKKDNTEYGNFAKERLLWLSISKL